MEIIDITGGNEQESARKLSKIYSNRPEIKAATENYDYAIAQLRKAVSEFTRLHIQPGIDMVGAFVQDIACIKKIEGIHQALIIDDTLIIVTEALRMRICTSLTTRTYLGGPLLIMFRLHKNTANIESHPLWFNIVKNKQENYVAATPHQIDSNVLCLGSETRDCLCDLHATPAVVATVLMGMLRNPNTDDLAGRTVVYWPEIVQTSEDPTKWKLSMLDKKMLCPIPVDEILRTLPYPNKLPDLRQRISIPERPCALEDIKHTDLCLPENYDIALLLTEGVHQCEVCTLQAMNIVTGSTGEEEEYYEEEEEEGEYEDDDPDFGT